MATSTSFLSYERFFHLKVSLVLTLTAVLVYGVYDPIGGRNGGTALGYSLGAVSTLLIFWLLWLGVRKRDYGTTSASLKGWLSAHVYLGLSLLVLVPLHSGLQFGWNLHTLAYGLLVVVVVSGLFGTVIYATLPGVMTANRQGRPFDDLLIRIAEIDSDLRNVAGDLADGPARTVARSIDDTRIGGSIRHSLQSEDPTCPTSRALSELPEFLLEIENDARGGREPINQALELLARKKRLLATARRDVWHRTIMNIWLLVHVPIAFAMLAAVAVHVFVVFYYW